MPSSSVARARPGRPSPTSDRCSRRQGGRCGESRARSAGPSRATPPGRRARSRCSRCPRTRGAGGTRRAPARARRGARAPRRGARRRGGGRVVARGPPRPRRRAAARRARRRARAAPRGEAVTVLVPVAQALTALHREGRSHGRLDATSVVVTSGGRVVLRPPLAPTTASTADDVRDLARTVLGLVPPPATSHPAHAAPLDADEARALAALHAELAVALRDEPAARPAVGTFAARCYDAVGPRPIAMPDAARLVAGALAGRRKPRRSCRDGAWPVTRSPRRPDAGGASAPPRPGATGARSAAVRPPAWGEGRCALRPRTGGASGPAARLSSSGARGSSPRWSSRSRSSRRGPRPRATTVPRPPARRPPRTR